MPLPKPNKDESRDKFVSRCIEDNVTTSEFPNLSQRVAVCINLFEDKDKPKNEIDFDHEYNFTKKEMEELHENGVLYVTQTDGKGTEMVIKFTYKNKYNE